MAKDNTLKTIMLIGGVIAFVIFGLPWLSTVITVPQSVVDVGAPSQEITDCQSSTTPELQVSAYQSIATATPVTDINGYLYLMGALSEVNLLSSDAKFDASPGDGYKLILYDDDGSATYYGRVAAEGTVPCKELEPIQTFVDKIGSISTTAYNTDNDTNGNSSSNVLPISAGEAKRVLVKFQETTNDATFGSRYSGEGMILCVNYDATYITDSDVTGVGSATPVATPYGASSANATRDIDQCFRLDKKFLDEWEYFKPVIVLTASASNDPTDQNVVVTLYDSVLYQDDLGVWRDEVTDIDTGSDLGVTSGTSATIYTG